MHQQIRVSLSSPSSTTDGTGAMAAVPIENDPTEVQHGALSALLNLIASQQWDIRAASGHNIETGGVFVFAVDDDDDKMLPSRIAQFLRDNKYRAHVHAPWLGEVSDEVGALARLVDEATSDGSLIQDILVGLPQKPGDKIEIQMNRLKVSSGVQA